MDPVERFGQVIFVGIVLIMVGLFTIFQIQVRLNSRAITTITTRQILQMDNAKSKMDQGYYDGKEYFFRKRNVSNTEKVYLMNSYDENGNKITNKSAVLVPSKKFGIPTKNNPYEYGQPYGFSNKQKWRWKTVFGPSADITLHQARTGVNRGNFGRGYIYQGTIDKTNRNLEVNP